ncbi:MAG: selenocysteine-specific translation elongation factor, partial [bacterium]
MSGIPSLVMGTAGHVDHGKTTLVKSLTGVDLDTLAEEKSRGLTINLGFTSFTSKSGHQIGVVDVPGHKRFIKTMLSGAHGIDFVLFLVASDDSVMPQTREHLQILQLLGIEKGIIGITKIDLIEDDLREIVVEEVKELVSGTFLENAPVHQLSAVTGEGLEGLKQAIDEMAAEVKHRERGAFFRMYVDRAFTVAGAGVVATGTTLAGAVSPGDELEVLPDGGKARVRKIEVHGKNADKTRPGQRTAVNLRAVDKTEIKRGDLLAAPGMVRTTFMIDARIEVLPEFPRPVRHWTRIRFYIGTHESFGRIVLLDTDQVNPGEWAYAQVRMEAPCPAVNGDLFIIRDFSASWTMGGGKVLDAHPTKHKRKRALVVSDLERRESGYLQEVVELEARKTGYFMNRNETANQIDAPRDRVGQAAQELAGKGKVVVLPPKKDPWIIHAEGWERLKTRIINILKKHHQALPQLETGLSEQELRDKLSRETGAHFPEDAFHNALSRLAEDQVLKMVESTYALSEHSASLAESDQAALARIRAMYADNPLSPPLTEDVYKQSGLP